MAITQFSPNTKIQSSQVNSNFNQLVQINPTQKIYNKINVLSQSTGSTSGSTITLNCNNANFFLVTLGGNATIEFSNIELYQPIIVRLRQGGAGGHTVTWPTGVRWPNGITPTLSTQAGVHDLFGFIQYSSIPLYFGVVMAFSIQ